MYGFARWVPLLESYVPVSSLWGTGKFYFVLIQDKQYYWVDRIFLLLIQIVELFFYDMTPVPPRPVDHASMNDPGERVNDRYTSRSSWNNIWLRGLGLILAPLRGHEKEWIRLRQQLPVESTQLPLLYKWMKLIKKNRYKILIKKMDRVG